jgi:hypothetical protein
MESSESIEVYAKSYHEMLKTFKGVTELFSGLFSTLDDKTDKWKWTNNDRLKALDGTIILKMIFGMYDTHQVLNTIRHNITKLYNNFVMIYGQPGVIHNLNCGQYPVNECYEYIDHTTTGEKLLSDMIKLALSESQNIWAEEVVFDQAKAIQNDGIEKVHEKMCGTLHPKEGDDVCGYPTPTIYLARVFKKLLSDDHNSKNGALLEACAKLTTDFELVFEELVFEDYKDIADILILKEDGVNENQLRALWYVTKCYATKKRRYVTQYQSGIKSMNQDAWLYFREILKKLQGKIIQTSINSADGTNVLIKYLDHSSPNYFSYVLDPSAAPEKELKERIDDCSAFKYENKTYVGCLSLQDDYHSVEEI